MIKKILNTLFILAVIIVTALSIYNPDLFLVGEIELLDNDDVKVVGPRLFDYFKKFQNMRAGKWFFEYSEFQGDNEIKFSNNAEVIVMNDGSLTVSILPDARIFHFDSSVFTEDEIHEMADLLKKENKKKVSKREVFRFVIERGDMIVDMRIATDVELTRLEKEQEERIERINLYKDL